MNRPTLFIGVMSGTSLDGIDVAVLSSENQRYLLIATGFRAYTKSIKDACLALCSPGADEIARAGQLGNALADAYADVIQETLVNAKLDASEIRAIGCHGQTVRHMPQDGYSIQIVNGARLAERCGIDVICDFRSRDIAAGGQGAPLVPTFHAAVFEQENTHRAVVNIGGIANITDLRAGKEIRGFDCGPGNVFLDYWAQQHIGTPCDLNGAWAASGSIDTALLNRFLADPFFALVPPKSTGREYFNAQWLSRHLTSRVDPVNVQATLAQLTVETIAQSIEAHATSAQEIYICGGGAHNAHLIQALGMRLKPRLVTTTAKVGIDPDWVEAAAFAWLAEQWVNHAHGNSAAVTGARGSRILGACYPA